MANFASLRGPVGLNRVYATVPAGLLKIETWLKAVKRGQTFAANGPLLGLKLGGKEIGDTLQLPGGKNEVKLTAWLRSLFPSLILS
jgi:TolB protein